jgi:nucleotide-binding universal stress UspA family protein
MQPTALQQRGVDLIVMGAHGKTGVKKLLTGSATEKVIGSAGWGVPS